MRIKNGYNRQVYWRVFKGDDTVYMFGLKDGFIDNNGEVTWRDDSFPKVKVEIKVDDTFVVSAGQTFNVTDDLFLDSAGKLDVAKVAAKESGQATVQKTDVQFFDARNFNETTSRTISFAIENAFSTSEGLRQSHDHSQTWSVGGKIGGELGEKDVAKVDAELSVGFEDKVVDSLQNSYEKQVNTVWKQSVSDTFKFLPGKIYAIEVTWRVVLKEGTVSYYGEKTSFSVVSSAQGTLTTPSAYNSVEEMPKHLKEKYDAFVN